MNKEFYKNAVMNNKDLILPPFNKLIDILEFEGICALSDYMGGSNLYIPNIKRIFRKCLQSQIPIEFNGFNYRELCIRYDLSETTIRKILDLHNKLIKGNNKLKSK